MSVIELTTHIAAPRERVFDLSRSIELHLDSTKQSGERAVAGVMSGLIGLGEEVTWHARHFGVWQKFTSRVTKCDRPSHFTDVMMRGAFKSMEHHHYFDEDRSVTTMRDVFAFTSPLGLLGRIADALVLERYMRAFLVERNRVIKAAAESDGWKHYLACARDG